MDWSKGFSARYYISVVDKQTWRDLYRLEIVGGSVKRSLSDLRESADINCVDYSSDIDMVVNRFGERIGNSAEQLIRVWLDAKQEGASSHTPIFTGLGSSPGRNINGRYETNTIQCYSVLKIAQDILLPRGWYAPAAANGGALIKNLLSIIGAPIYISDNSPELKSAIIAEQGENNLSMADKILDAMNWRLRLSGLGEIFIEPITNDPIAIFNSLDNDILETSLSVTNDWYNCPNVYRAVSGDTFAMARDDSVDSIFSTINRGREIWVEDTSCYLNAEETLADYAKRRLKEEQQVSYNLSYSRRFDPDVRIEDVVTINYPEQKISGNFLITSQSIELTHGGRTSEEAIRL